VSNVTCVTEQINKQTNKQRSSISLQKTIEV